MIGAIVRALIEIFCFTLLKFTRALGELTMHLNIRKFIGAVLLCLTVSMPTLGWARTADEAPSALAMSGDALFVRPVMLAGTLIGAGLFIVSSPFSLLGGNFAESFDVLVGGPFETTFIRCLGCSQPGYQHDKATQKKMEDDVEEATDA
jgi:hypothetical protein